MGSVMTEVVHETAHPWSSAMVDAQAHQRQPEQQSYDLPYTTTSHSRSNSSHSRRRASTARSSHSTPQPPTASRTPSLPVHQSGSQVSSAAAHKPASQGLPPSDVVGSTQAPMTSTPQSATAASSPHLADSTSASPHKIVVRDLQHIQEMADTDMFSDNAGDTAAAPQYLINDMHIDQIIEMVAGLLTKITATNDKHYEQLHRSIPPPDAAANLSPRTTSVLAFHGKNVPSISILQYLGRIQKYCPATYEVFLALLVYFDRMTERVNWGQMQSLRQADHEYQEKVKPGADAPRSTSETITPPSSEDRSPRTEHSDSTSTQQPHQTPPSPPLSDSDPTNLSSFFVVDSFNIHRLVIAGVTCSAKFFSDVFFTNSRYAKVGGLPLAELNHLELQFLLLNDFRLAIPVEELDQYATMLVEFYAREVVAQKQAEAEKMHGVQVDSH